MVEPWWSRPRTGSSGRGGVRKLSLDAEVCGCCLWARRCPEFHGFSVSKALGSPGCLHAGAQRSRRLLGVGVGPRCVLGRVGPILSFPPPPPPRSRRGGQISRGRRRFCAGCQAGTLGRLAAGSACRPAPPPGPRTPNPGHSGSSGWSLPLAAPVLGIIPT